MECLAVVAVKSDSFYESCFMKERLLVIIGSLTKNTN